MVYSNYVGARVRRKEDPRLITGSSTYVGDVKLPGMLHCAILRSPYAHARIKSIDASAALAHPGVVAVFTGEQMKKMAGPMAGGGGEGGDVEEEVRRRKPRSERARKAGSAVSPRHRQGAPRRRAGRGGDRHRYVYRARRRGPGRSRLGAAARRRDTWKRRWRRMRRNVFGDKPDNVGLHWEKTSGDVDAAFAEAEKDGIVLDLHIVSQRLAAVPMEGRARRRRVGCLAGRADRLELQSEPAQRPLDDRKSDRHVGVGCPRDRAGSRRRLRREDRRVPGRCHRLRHCARTEAARQVDRVPRGEHAGDEPRARSGDQGAGRGAQGRHGARPQGEDHRQYRRVSARRRACPS